MTSLQQAITIIGIPVRATDRSHVDQIVKFISHNCRQLDKHKFKVVIDTNGMTSELNDYLSAKLANLRSHLTVIFSPHTEADGRTASMNRIAKHGLDTEPNLRGVVYVNDNILLEPQAIENLAQQLEQHPLVGGSVAPLDVRDRQDTTLVEQAMLDFKYRTHKQYPHLHGAFFGMSKNGLVELQKEGFLPALHFEDIYLIIRDKMQYGSSHQIPVVSDAKGYVTMSSSWEAAIDKIARYTVGQRQLIDYFAKRGNEEAAKELQRIANDIIKAQKQFLSCFTVAQKAAAEYDLPAEINAEIAYIIGIWSKRNKDTVSASMPNPDQIQNVLSRLIIEERGGYRVHAPEVALPLLNSIINFLGVSSAELDQRLDGSSWRRGTIPFKPERQARAPIKPDGSFLILQSGIPEECRQTAKTL